MEIRRIPAEQDAVRRYVEELWVPYHRDLAAVVEAHDLADAGDDELVAHEIEFRLDRLSDEDDRAWVAVDGDASADALADVDGAFVGFVTASVDEAPPVFERPDRVVVGDLYVEESRRGSGLARDLVERVATWAGERNCEHLDLNVDVDNERALAFYEKLGFEPRRYRMCADVEEL